FLCRLAQQKSSDMRQVADQKIVGVPSETQKFHVQAAGGSRRFLSKRTICEMLRQRHVRTENVWLSNMGQKPRELRRLRPPSGNIYMPQFMFGGTCLTINKGKGCNMSILKSRELARSGKQAEIEGNIRELVRQQSGAIRYSDPAGEQATSDL